jgi:hypothetical protein
VFRLNRAATVTLRIKRLAPPRRARRSPKLVTLRRTGQAGGNRVRFSGRVGRRALRPGRYRATVASTDATGRRSTPRRVTFRILPG